MKIIRISTNNEISVHDFPEGNHTEQNRVLRELIGDGCCIYEHVMPRRLYTDLHMKNRPTRLPGQCVSMLVDEEGGLKEGAPNLIGSYLYETDKPGYPIMGNVLFVGEQWDENGIDFCGIEASTFTVLHLQLNKLVLAGKGGVIGKFQ